MELTEKQKETQEVFAKVLAEAWENEAFKQELITNPNETIEKFTGEKLNLKPGTKLEVVDQSENSTFYFNIPARPSVEDMELNEEQLALVAGGGFGDFLKAAAAVALAPAVVLYTLATQ